MNARELDRQVSDLVMRGRNRRDPDPWLQHYSTDVTYAWLAVEQMRADGWQLILFSDLDCGGRRVPYAATFQRHGDGDYHGEGDTVAWAICCAIVRAKA